MAEDLGALIREKWASMLADGFKFIEERIDLVELRSSEVCVSVVLDPRGEIDVDAYPLYGDRHLGWAYTGLVGKATVGRLLEIALEQMHSEPAILRGDVTFYQELAGQRAAEAQALTEFYAGRGPNPRRSRLP